MKISRNKSFSPVTLVIETEEELAYMYALSNSSVSQVRSSAKSLEIELPEDFASTQMSLYNQLQEIYL